MKLEWDELKMLASFVEKRFDQWREHVEWDGFEFHVAEAIAAKVMKMAQDEQRVYLEKMGEQKPSMASCYLQVTKGEHVFDIRLEWYDTLDWQITRVPGYVAFVLLSKTPEAAIQKLEDRGWSWKYVGERTPKNFP